MKKTQSMLYRYFKILIFILIIPIIVINLSVNYAFTQILLKNEQTNLKKTMYQTSKIINDETKRISLVTSTLYNSEEIVELINKWHIEQDPSNKLMLSRQIGDNLNYLFNFSNEVESIMFFFKDKGVYTYKNQPQISYLKMKEMDWYHQAKNKIGEVCVLEPQQGLFQVGEEKFILSTAIAPRPYEMEDQVEMIYVALKMTIPSYYDTEELSQSKQEMYILGEDNTILVAQNKDLVGRTLQELGIGEEIVLSKEPFSLHEINGDKMLVTVQPIKKTSWKLVGVIDYQYMTRDIHKVNQYMWIMYLGLFMSFILYSVFYLKEILLPIKKLIKKMGKVQKGDFKTTMVLDENTEINNLAQAFNEMVFEINNLIKERDLKEKERNNAELEMLQSQINPHFLSNTLNAIRFMAMMAKVDNISKVTEALIRLLHASFAKTGKYITIEDEIANLQSYIHIMEIRYVNQFKITIDIDDQLKHYYMLRLLLQPIVENAILYGANAAQRQTEITIIGRLKEECVLFEVKDNGIGMSGQQIEKILFEECENTNGFTHIGVGNVNKRIQLNSGENYGVHIESEVGEYTHVSIKLPVLKTVAGSGSGV